MSADAVAWLEEQPTAYPWERHNRMDSIQTDLFSVKRDHEQITGDEGWCPMCLGAAELIVLDYLDVPTPTL